MKWLLLCFAALLTVSTGLSARNFVATEYGNMNVVDTNTEGYPIFDAYCRRDQCVDHRNHVLGTEQQIARRIPVIPREAVYANRYPCHYVCWDHRDNIIGAAPQNL